MSISPARSSAAARPARRSDWGQLLFCGACAGLAALLAVADYLPQMVSVAVVTAIGVLFLVRAIVTRTLAPRTMADWPNVLTLLLLPVGLWVSFDGKLNWISWLVVCRIVAGMAVFYGLAGLAGTRWLVFLPGSFLLLSLAVLAFVAVDTQWPASKMPLLPGAFYQTLPAFQLPGRAAGGFNPNLTGGTLALFLLPAVALLLWGEGRWLRLLALLTAGLIGMVLLLSQSRGAWIAAALALLIMPGLRWRRWWIVVLALMVAAAVGLWAVEPERIAQAVFPAVGVSESTVNTLSGRLEIWSRALYLIQDFSFTGAGPGRFHWVVNLLYPLFTIGPDAEVPHAHNTFLQAAADFGIPGLIAHVAFLLTLAAGLLATVRRNREGTLPALAVGLLGALLVYLLHGMIDALYASQRAYVLASVTFGVMALLSIDRLTPQQATDSPGPAADANQANVRSLR